MLRAGDELQGRYVCQERLGGGGQGSVYRVEDRRLRGKVWALKELTVADPALADRLQSQFESEARTLAHLDHPSLPNVVDFFTEDERHYLVMELVEGDDLERRVEIAGGPLPEAQVVDIGRQLCDILAYLHGQQPHAVIHRDLKPANVKLMDSGQVKLVDFGLAKVAARGDPSRTAIRGSGTPGFAPLEQYGQQGGTDARSDLYALGCCLYFLATAAVPPEAPDRAANPRLLKPLRSLNPGLTPELASVIERAMAVNAADRHADAAALRRDLLRTGTLHAGADAACARCGAPLEAGRKFCARCGAPVGLRQSARRAAIVALIGGLVGVGAAWLPLLALSGPGGRLLIAATIGGVLFGGLGATGGTLVGFAVAPARLLFLRQATSLLAAALLGEALLLAIGVAVVRAVDQPLPALEWSIPLVVIGGSLGGLALLRAPGVRAAWPR